MKCEYCKKGVYGLRPCSTAYEANACENRPEHYKFTDTRPAPPPNTGSTKGEPPKKDKLTELASAIVHLQLALRAFGSQAHLSAIKIDCDDRQLHHILMQIRAEPTIFSHLDRNGLFSNKVCGISIECTRPRSTSP